jgi:hypothetical protein
MYRHTLLKAQLAHKKERKSLPGMTKKALTVGALVV